ncbi:hypothetical protein PR048_023805 [Dryococelus australis]|uniref:Uncharacterized protein n=1 Tax=Dryococelus australis TaxID=614101 RepID=A0ABQ9GV69_9NEOP|nr:hypothetical protein PR048_023805 [Dryococelus australis]
MLDAALSLVRSRSSEVLLYRTSLSLRLMLRPPCIYVLTNVEQRAGASMAEGLDCSPTTRGEPGSIPGRITPGFSQAMPLIGGFSRGSTVTPALAFRHIPIIASFYPHRFSRRIKMCGLVLNASHQRKPGSIRRLDHSRMLARGTRTRRRRYLEGSLGYLPVSRAPSFGAAPCPPRSASSALKFSLLRAAQISPLSHSRQTRRDLSREAIGAFELWRTRLQYRYDVATTRDGAAKTNTFQEIGDSLVSSETSVPDQHTGRTSIPHAPPRFQERREIFPVAYSPIKETRLVPNLSRANLSVGNCAELFMEEQRKFEYSPRPHWDNSCDCVRATRVFLLHHSTTTRLGQDIDIIRRYVCLRLGQDIDIIRRFVCLRLGPDNDIIRRFVCLRLGPDNDIIRRFVCLRLGPDIDIIRRFVCLRLGQDIDIIRRFVCLRLGQDIDIIRRFVCLRLGPDIDIIRRFVCLRLVPPVSHALHRTDFRSPQTALSSPNLLFLARHFALFTQLDLSAVGSSKLYNCRLEGPSWLK